MAVTSSGQISLSDIASEFGDTAPYQMSEYYRGGGLVPNAPDNSGVPTSGQIGIGNFYGATNRIAVPLTISASTTTPYDVTTSATASPLYVAGISDITLTVNPGVTQGASGTGVYSIYVPNGLNAGDNVTIVNNGHIQGVGGNGGFGGHQHAPQAGGAGAGGGSAVYVNRPTTITNNGTISGGGGGGGGGAASQPVTYGSVPSPKGSVPSVSTVYRGGGGGGGGSGYSGGSGGPGGWGQTFQGSPGAAGTSPAGGAGGSSTSQAGGAGGGRGAAGQPSNGAGGAAGYYLVGNPYVTWPATGTLNGSVS